MALARGLGRSVHQAASGFTSGLAQLVVSTRNNLGISQDTEICVNYGVDYDFSGMLQTVGAGAVSVGA